MFDPLVDSNQLRNTVIRGGYCVGCGVCAVANASEYRITMDSLGRYQATFTPRPNHSGLSKVVCPFALAHPNEDDIAGQLYGQEPGCVKHPVLGYFKALYAGYVSTGEYRERGSSGGFVSWLACELLKRKFVDGIIHVRRNVDRSPEQPLFVYSISSTCAEVLNGAKSRYYPVELSNVLSGIRDTTGVFALVAVPCFAKAVRLLQLTDSQWTRRFAFVIGLLCGHMKSARFVDFIAWQLGLSPASVTDVDFRGKSPERPSNDYLTRLEIADGTRAIVREAFLTEIEGGDWGQGYFKYKACDFCDDIFAETADVAAGDAWLPKYSQDWRGTNVVLVRNTRLDQLIRDGIASGVLAFESLSPEETVATQRAAVRHRRDGLAYRLWKSTKRGVWIPPKRVKPGEQSLDRNWREIFRLRSQIAESSQCVSLKEDPWVFLRMRMRLHPLVRRYQALYTGIKLRQSARLRLRSYFRALKNATRTIANTIRVAWLRRWVLRRKRSGTVLLAPAAPGSLGDEAVVHAAAIAIKERLDQPVTIVVPGKPPHRFDVGVDVDWVWHDRFSNGRWGELTDLLSQLSYHSRLIILGTDILDGFYSVQASVGRLDLARMATKLGFHTAIVGFSFDERAPAEVLAALAGLPEEVGLYVRDPISYRVLTEGVGKRAVCCADPAFLLPAGNESPNISDVMAWLRDKKRTGHLIIAVNVNHHLVRKQKLDQVALLDNFSKLLVKLSSHYAKIAFLLVPHDARGKPNDFELALALMDSLPKEVGGMVRIHPFPCRATEVKAVIAHVDCIFTGKMHLAIAGLGQEVPVGTISYISKKFEGLFEHFDLGEWVLPPEAGLHVDVLFKFVTRLIDERDQLRNQIRRRLPAVVKMAKANFEWL